MSNSGRGKGIESKAWEGGGLHRWGERGDERVDSPWLKKRKEKRRQGRKEQGDGRYSKARREKGGTEESEDGEEGGREKRTKSLFFCIQVASYT